MNHNWPYAIQDAHAIPGTIKMRYEDFSVEEIPAYEPSGQGDHVYFLIEKRGLSTPRAVRDIARALGVRPDQIGSAGMKDARAVSRQMLSLEHVDPGRVEKLDIPRVSILKVSRHRNKLRMGHLLGNRFVIRLRDTDLEQIDEVSDRMEILVNNGVPNYFGPQRFGNRGDTWQIGKALLLGDPEAAAEIIAGRPGPSDTGDVLKARELFQDGQYEESLRAWPRGFGECAILCREMKRRKGDHKKALNSLGRKTLGFYVSAYQSWLFNKVLAARIRELGQIFDGDIAWKHDSGAVFLVEDQTIESKRAERFEISATGPLYGHKMKLPMGRAADLERDIIEKEGVALDCFQRSGSLRCRGGRRALRFKPWSTGAEAGQDEHGSYIQVCFALQSGCYATLVLKEIFKERLVHAEAPPPVKSG